MFFLSNDSSSSPNCQPAMAVERETSVATASFRAAEKTAGLPLWLRPTKEEKGLREEESPCSSPRASGVREKEEQPPCHRRPRARELHPLPPSANGSAIRRCSLRRAYLNRREWRPDRYGSRIEEEEAESSSYPREAETTRLREMRIGRSERTEISRAYSVHLLLATKHSVTK